MQFRVLIHWFNLLCVFANCVSFTCYNLFGSNHNCANVNTALTCTCANFASGRPFVINLIKQVPNFYMWKICMWYQPRIDSLFQGQIGHATCWDWIEMSNLHLLAPVPLSIFRSNSKFDENSERSSFDRSQRYFAHVTTVTLSWRVQNIVVIGHVYFTIECFEFSSNLEFDRNMLIGTGA